MSPYWLIYHQWHIKETNLVSIIALLERKKFNKIKYLHTERVLGSFPGVEPAYSVEC